MCIRDRIIAVEAASQKAVQLAQLPDTAALSVAARVGRIGQRQQRRDADHRQVGRQHIVGEGRIVRSGRERRWKHNVYTRGEVLNRQADQNGLERMLLRYFNETVLGKQIRCV